MTLAESLAHAVRSHGADTVFGIPGGGPNLDVIGAAEAVGLRFVLAHHETAACIMAGTYGLITGRPAMAIATRGPGVANAANGLAQATYDRFPLLFVSDCVGSAERGRVAHQRFDQPAFTRPVTKWSGTVADDGAAADLLAASLALASAAPAGAVHLDYDPAGTSGSVPTASATPEPGDLDAARRALQAAHRPVAIVGLGAVPDADEVCAALQRVGCPVLSTYQGCGVIPEGNAQLAGLFTSGVIESQLLDRADLVLAVGFDAVEPMPPPWRYTTNVIAIGEVAPVSTFLPIAHDLRGPVGSVLSSLVAGCTPNEWASGADELMWARSSLREAAAGSGFGPLDLVEGLIAHARPPGPLTVTVDAGAHFLAIMPFWPATAPLRLLISNGSATMGFALPAAIGAALARPGEAVLCLTGDGGLGMCVAELETMARLRLPVTVVVFADAALSLIEIKQRAGHGGEGAVRYGDVDHAAIARAVGIDAVSVSSAGELERAFRSTSYTGPRLVEARIDPFAYRGLIRTTRG